MKIITLKGDEGNKTISQVYEIGHWSMARLLILAGVHQFLFSFQTNRQTGLTILLNDTATRTVHIGLSIYEPATDTYRYNYNATKYFIPASNTKLFMLYAGMKYLGDSLQGAGFYHCGNSIFITLQAAPPLENLSCSLNKKIRNGIGAGLKTKDTILRCRHFIGLF